MVEMAPGSIRGLHLVVKGIDAARQALMAKDVAVEEITEQGEGVKYAAFSDPEGNSWTLQGMPWRSDEWS
jgi:uncharacterized glyoxalase superfamily protein PhnB